ncbi:MAG: GNAT family N-acetyltransferase [Clostridiales bacterium]|nr:GNAT family N-acetyltransferase [Clostridiales bacterium]
MTQIHGHLESLTPEELAGCFLFLAETFPENEMKPLNRLLELYRRGIYDMWKLVDDGAVHGYALLLRGEGSRYVLLDYLAVLDRGHGWGTVCLALLQARYPQGILVEAEAPLPGLSAEELALRERRIRFYQRSGFVPCPFDNCVFGVVYLIHLWAPELPEDRSTLCARELYRYYQMQLPQQMLEKYITIQGLCPAKEEHP